MQFFVRLWEWPRGREHSDDAKGTRFAITRGWSRRTKLTVSIVTVLAGLVILFAAREILAPFVWAIVIAYLFSPIVSLARRRVGIPRPILVLLLYAIGINAIFWTIWLVSPLLARELRLMVQSVPEFTAWIEVQITGTDTLDILGQTIRVDAAVEALADPLRGLATDVSTRLLALAFGILEAFLKVLLALVAAFYLLLAGPRLIRRLIGLVPDEHRPEIESLVARLNDVLSAFVRGQLLLVIIMATATYVGLSILGIPFAVVLAVATGFLELIPIFGPIVAAIPPILLALFGTNTYGWPGWLAALVVAAMYTVLRHLEDYIVIPNVVGRVINIHPFVALFALFAGATIWGISGMILALPVAAMTRVILSYVYRKITI